MLFYVTTKALYIFGLSELAFVFFLWAGYFCPRSWQRMSKISIVFFVFVITQVVAAIFGVDPWFSAWSNLGRMTGVFFLVHLAILFVVACNLLKTQKDWVRFFACSVGVALCVSALFLFAEIGVDVLFRSNSGSTLGNSTFLGTYLLFHIFFSAYLFFVGKGTWLRPFGAMAAVVLISTLLLTDARAATVSLFGGALLALCLWLIFVRQMRSQKRIGLILLGGLIVLFTAICILLFIPGSFIQDKFIDLATASRFVIWDMAWKGFMERPLLGWGPSNFETVALQFYNPCFGSDLCGLGFWTDRAHNIILDVLNESGVIGLAAYLGIFFAATCSLLRPSTIQKNHWSVPVIFVSLLAAYFVQNLTAFDSPTSWLYLIFVLAFCHAVQQSDFTQECERSLLETQYKRTLPIIPIFATVILFFTFPFFVIQPFRGISSVKGAISASTMEEHLMMYERAMTISKVGIDFRRAHLAYQSARIMLNSSFESMQRVAPSAKTELALAERGLMDTISRAPNDLRAYISLSMVYRTQGRFFEKQKYEEARHVLLEAIELNPNNPYPYWALASVFLEQGKYVEGLELAQLVLDRNDGVYMSHIQRMIALKFMGDEELMEKIFQESVLSHPKLEKSLRSIISSNLAEDQMELLLSLYGPDFLVIESN